MTALRGWFSGRTRPCQGRDESSILSTRTKKSDKIVSMYTIFKIFFSLSVVIIGVFGLKNNPSAAIFWIGVPLVILIGIFKNTEWGYIFTFVFSGFVICALMFNGFYAIDDYVMFYLSILLVILTYPYTVLRQKHLHQ